MRVSGSALSRAIDEPSSVELKEIEPECRDRAKVRKAPPREKVAMIWAEERASEGKKFDWQRLSCRREGSKCCRGGGREDLLLVGSEPQNVSKDYERLCATAEALPAGKAVGSYLGFSKRLH